MPALVMAEELESRTARLASLLRCTQCGSSLERVASAYRCAGCGTVFPLLPSNQIDMRPRVKVIQTVSFELEPPDAPRDTRGDRLQQGAAEVPALLPAAPAPGMWALEIGCGNNSLRQQIESAGWTYMGVDYSTAGADILVDVHALPFASGTFGIVVAKALLEHVRFPHLAVREMSRVLAPGGTMVGDVAFLQPFHDSYYHMTHAAVKDLLESAGLRLVSYSRGRESVFTYLGRNAYLPAPAATILALCAYPVDLLYRALTLLKRKVLARTEDQRMYLAVGITFTADRAAEPRLAEMRDRPRKNDMS